MGGSPSAPNQGNVRPERNPHGRHQRWLAERLETSASRRDPARCGAKSGVDPVLGLVDERGIGLVRLRQRRPTSRLSRQRLPGEHRRERIALRGLFSADLPLHGERPGHLRPLRPGGPQQQAIQSNGTTDFYEWSSGVINTEGKRYFPFGSATEFYLQVNAKNGGPEQRRLVGHLDALPRPGRERQPVRRSTTGQEMDVDGPNRYAMVSHGSGPRGRDRKNFKASTTLDGNYHVYGCHVNSSTHTVTMLLDGAQAGTFTGAQVGARYFLILHATVSSGQASWEKSEGSSSRTAPRICR